MTLGTLLGFQKKKSDANQSTLKLLENRMIAIELAGEGIGISEADGTISFVNKAFADMYRYPSWQSVVGMKWLDLTEFSTRTDFERRVMVALRTKKAWVGSGIGLRYDGTTFFKSVSVSSLPDGRWIFLVRDVSDQMTMEQTADRRLAAIEAAGDGIGLVDPQGNLTYMNKSLKALHEFNDNDMVDYIGHSWTHLYTDLGQRQIRDIVLPSLKRTGYWKGESPILTKSGRIVYAEMSMTLLDDGGMIGTARDVTDKKNAQKEHEKLERQFYQMQKMEAIGRLAGGIAHDFNNLLASMMGYAEFLMEDLPPDSRQHHFAKSIMEGGMQARNVVSRLLMFARTHEHSIETVDISDVLRETLNLIRSSVPATISIRYSEIGDNHCVSGDRTLISQALMNLFVNAKDAITDRQHGEIVVSLGVEIFHAQDHKNAFFSNSPDEGLGYVVVGVRDSGCGMDPQTMDQIFDPFFTTKPVDQGTGLGLATVHGIMESHDGSVYVTSQVGAGSEFRLYFPALDSHTAVAPVAVRPAAPTITDHKRLRIMVVEDQASVREMVRIMLERMGHHVATCADGLCAIDQLRENPGAYQLVMTDQTMPGMTGFELAQQINHDFSSLPVILMSGFSQDSLNQMQKDLPIIRAVIHKPIDFDALVLAIERAVTPVSVN